MLELSTNPFREGLIEERVADACAFVIFGASGDLTHRKLIPALYNLSLQGLLPSNFAIIGFARREWDDASFRGEMREAVQQHAPALLADTGAWESFEQQLFYTKAEFADASGYKKLRERLAELRTSIGLPDNRLFYLATPPSQYETVVGNIGDAGLHDQRDGWSRLIVEKPLGRDVASSRNLNTCLGNVFSEEQIYRIDHYLGKETVQNILVFRFANILFEPIWNHAYVDHVQITNSESIGMEGRGAFFDQTGIVRDVIQNHQLQLLTLVAMEPPISTDAGPIRDEKVKVLRAVRPMKRQQVATETVRAQYTAGSIMGKPAAAYLDEPNVAPESGTESFAAMRLFIDNWRWAGVPFYLRVGKRLPRKATEISVQFKSVPGVLFGAGQQTPVSPDLLVMRIQPDEGISIRFVSKVPGQSMRLQDVRMGFRYGMSFGKPLPEAYERLLLDAATGEQALFARADEVDTAWQIVQPVLDAWAQLGRDGMAEYQAGTWGPAEAFELLERDGRSWRRP